MRHTGNKSTTIYQGSITYRRKNKANKQSGRYVGVLKSSRKAFLIRWHLNRWPGGREGEREGKVSSQEHMHSVRGKAMGARLLGGLLARMCEGLWGVLLKHRGREPLSVVHNPWQVHYFIKYNQNVITISTAIKNSEFISSWTHSCSQTSSEAVSLLKSAKAGSGGQRPALCILI